MFSRGLRLFSIFGFEVKLDWSWLILAVLITWSLAAGYFPASYPHFSTLTYVIMGVAGAIGLFVSVVFHELSHSLVARMYGIPMRGITLFIFGGVAQMTEEAQNPKSEFLMAIAGPIASLVIGVFFWLLTVVDILQIWPEPVAAVFTYLAFINVLLAAFNMIPAFPLDGGRVLRAALWKWKNDLEWSTRITTRIGSGFGMLMILAGGYSFLTGNLINGVWLVLLGLFLRYLARNAYNNLVLQRSLDGERVRRFVRHDVDSVLPTDTIQDLVDNHLFRHYQRLVPVVENSHLVGCVTLDAVKQLNNGDWRHHSVSEIVRACSDENTIDADNEAATALTLMSRGGDRSLMVVDHDKFLGIVTMRDIMSYLRLRTELKEAG